MSFHVFPNVMGTPGIGSDSTVDGDLREAHEVWAGEDASRGFIVPVDPWQARLLAPMSPRIISATNLKYFSAK